MARPRVLITGFGPFPGVPDNPSAWLAATLAEQRLPEFDGELHMRVLSTEWRPTQLIPRLYEALQPHVMIHFGVDRRAKALRIERFAHNRAAPRADASGALPSGSLIHPEGADRHETQIPAVTLAAHLRRRGISAVASRSAGSYLCNFLYYHSLDWARRQDNASLALFVHIPLLQRAGPFTEGKLLLAARETLQFVLNIAQERSLSVNPTGPAFARNAALLSAKEA